MNIKNRTIILFPAVLFIASVFSTPIFAKPNFCSNYPHWNCNKPQQLKTLSRIEKFIRRHPQHRGIIAFDWDGTLYGEQITLGLHNSQSGSSQSVWHIWGAQHLASYPYLFPSFKTGDGNINEQATNIIRTDNYLEWRTEQPNAHDPNHPLHIGGYNKFIQTANYETGMSLEQMRKGMQGYLNDTPPQRYAYLKTLDILQRFQDLGFTTWIVTGSNNYFVSNLITAPNGVNHTLGYHLFTACRPTSANYKNFIHNCHIAGNGAKLLHVIKKHQYLFTRVYDNRFVKKELQANQRAGIDKYGKVLVLKQLSKTLHLPVIAYAGNSNGDFAAMHYLLTQNKSVDVLGIFVHPTYYGKKFKALLKTDLCTEQQCIYIKHGNNPTTL